jgi:hypothetical protein
LDKIADSDAVADCREARTMKAAAMRKSRTNQFLPDSEAGERD